MRLEPDGPVPDPAAGSVMQDLPDQDPADQTEAYREAIEAAAIKQINRFRKAARGVTPRHCPLCGYFGMFTAFGNPPRLDARCPKCNSLERHRLLYLFAERFDLFRPSHDVLHFAPEVQLSGYLRDMVGRYETGDLSPRRKVTHHVNIEQTGLEGGRYDRIICSHVIEHVDDARALAEMFRLTRPGGIVILMTPIVEGWKRTYENPAVTASADRVLHFGQGDHLRMYGRDLRDRIRAAGFELAEYTAVEPDILRYGLMRGETVFVATRPEGTKDD